MLEGACEVSGKKYWHDKWHKLSNVNLSRQHHDDDDDDEDDDNKDDDDDDDDEEEEDEDDDDDDDDDDYDKDDDNDKDDDDDDDDDDDQWHSLPLPERQTLGDTFHIKPSETVNHYHIGQQQAFLDKSFPLVIFCLLISMYNCLCI